MPAGRPKGGKKYGGSIKGKSSRRAKLLEQIRASGKQGPVEVLLEEMWAENTEPSIKRKIAEVLLPYVERKQPTEIEADVKSEMTVTLNKGDDKL